VFVVISQRLEFVRYWTDTLRSRGEVVAFARLDDWARCLNGTAARLAVLDYALLGADPSDTLRQWRQRCEGAVLVLAGTEFVPSRELAALAAGVVACCDAGMSGEERGRVVDVVLQGGVWISPAALPHFVSRLQAFSARQEAKGADATAGTVAGRSFSALTERQRQVALLVGEGASNKKIANQLDITDRTVKAHLTMIFDKLDVNDRLQLALYMNKRSV